MEPTQVPIISIIDCNSYEIVAFLGGSLWNSKDKPLLSVDPDCDFTAWFPGSDIQNGCLFAKDRGCSLSFLSFVIGLTQGSRVLPGS